MFRLRKRNSKGQATTEVVLLFPLFMFFMFGMVKVFALLVLVQKMEIAGFYAARRWQLESHRNIAYEPDDDKNLRKDIAVKASQYLGCGNPAIEHFLDLVCANPDSMLTVERAQVWNIVTLRITTRPWRIPLMHFQMPPFSVVKYVPNRDRPITYDLPGTL